MWRATALAVFLVAGPAAHANIPTEPDLATRHQVIRQALAAAAPFERAVEQFHLHNGRFPASNGDLGLNRPDAYRNYDIQGIRIDSDGAIDLMLTETSGVAGGTIRLTPEPAGLVSENRIDWTCASASYSTISDATGGVCQYTNQP